MTPTGVRDDGGRRRSGRGRRRFRRRVGTAGVAPLVAVTALAPVACGNGGPESGESTPRGAPATEATVTPADSSRRAREIEAMLVASAADWNAGDLEGFLDDYSTDPGLTFTGSAGLLRGREAVRDRYLESYWAPGAERDSLRFEDLRVRPLGEDHTLTLGRYVLYRPGVDAATSSTATPGDSVTATGYFTLVLRREGGGWKIIHDHSS